MSFVSQTLSLLGMMAVAAVIVDVVRTVSGGEPNWMRLLGVTVFAVLCFWASARAKGRG